MESVFDSSGAAAIRERRSILKWRDRHLVAASLALNRAWQDVRPVVEEKLAAISWKSVLFESDAFVAREIDPLVADAVGTATQRIMAVAQSELDTLVSHQMEVERSLQQTSTEQQQDRWAGTVDLLAGVAPLAGGVAAGAAVPGLAIVSGTAFLGLVSTSVVSVPILVGGIVVVGALLSAGALQTSKIKDKGTARMLDRVRRHVEAAVLSVDPDAATPSVNLRLQNAITAAAKAALERLKNAG